MMTEGLLQRWATDQAAIFAVLRVRTGWKSGCFVVMFVAPEANILNDLSGEFSAMFVAAKFSVSKPNQIMLSQQKT